MRVHITECVFTKLLFLVFLRCSQANVCNIRGGVVENFRVSALTSNAWRICYSATYATHTPTSLFDNCNITSNTYLFLGATRSTDSHSSFLLGAFGLASGIQAATSASATKTITIGGVSSYWYRTSTAIGFAPTSSVSLNTCDNTNLNDSKRLCWQLGSQGGYRAGAATDLRNDFVHNKVILAKECTSTRTGNVLLLSTTSHATTLTALSSNGMVYTAITPTQWSTVSVSYIRQFDVVMFGDGGCKNDQTIIQVPGNNANVWGPAINGNIFVINTDEAHHNRPLPIQWGLRWAARVPGTTGLYLSLSCYGSMTVTALQYFGTFISVAQGQDPIEVVSSGTALGPLTNSDMSNWGATSHGYFSTYPSSSFFVVAQNLGDSSKPIVLARRDILVKTSSPTTTPTITPTRLPTTYTSGDYVLRQHFTIPSHAASLALTSTSLFVGAYNPTSGGSIEKYIRFNSTWLKEGSIEPFDREVHNTTGFGFSSAVSKTKNTLVVSALESNAVYVYSQKASVRKLNGTVNSKFGVNVGVTTNTIAIGAYGENSFKGAVSVYSQNTVGWVLQQTIRAVDGASNDNFGKALSIDGNTLAIGAFGDDTTKGVNSGSVYIYEREGTSWFLGFKLIASDLSANDFFGWSVLLKGNYLFVSAKGHKTNNNSTGAVYVYMRKNFGWFQVQKIVPSGFVSWFASGSQLAVDSTVSTLVVGASDVFPSSVFVFKRNGTVWTEKQRIIQPDVNVNEQFGWSIAVECDTLAVGAWASKKVYLYSNGQCVC